MAGSSNDLGLTLSATETDGAQESVSGVGSGEVLADRYQLLEMLGAGGMGTVYRAHDLELDEVIALKTLRSEYLRSSGALDRFRRELKLARRVTHRSVARAFDLGEHKGTRFLTMELIAGPSLARVLAERGVLDHEEVRRIGIAIAEGLAAAHAAGVVHRDLKPDNVLLEGDRVVITDFGVARTLTQEGGPHATAAGGVVGTPAYMAPEQVEGGLVDGRTDLYALGVVLFEAIAGRLPFTGNTIFALAAARVLAEAPPLRSVVPSCPETLAGIVDRALARAPSDRFESAVELARALAGANTPAVAVTTVTSAPNRRAAERRVAIIPLRNAGPSDDGWIAEGLADDLIDSLSLVAGVLVRARAPEPARDEDLRIYGRRLDVELVVEGSVRRAGDRVRANLRLVSTADGFQVWAQRFDASMAELLRIADTAASSIADALAGTELNRRRRATPPPEAVEYFLRAKRSHYTTPGSGITLMSKAIALAPDDPTMLATFALYAAEWAFGFASDPSLGTRSQEAAQRAIALAPDLPEAHLALARIHNACDDDLGAMREVVVARRHAPGMSEPDDLLGRFLSECDLLVEARLHLERALWIDPSPGQFAHVDLIRLDALESRWAEVAVQLDDIRGPNPTLHILTSLRMRLWGADIELPQPLAKINAELGLSEMLLRSVAEHGRITDEFEAGLAQLCSLVPPRSRPQRLWRQVETECRAAVGDLDDAARALRHAVEIGLRDLAWIKRCPLLEPLRSRPEYPELVVTVEARVAPRIAVYRDAGIQLARSPAR